MIGWPPHSVVMTTPLCAADYTHHLLLNGLEAVTQLLALAGEQKPDALPALGRLTQYLTEESRFMAQNAAEYGVAAQNLRRR